MALAKARMVLMSQIGELGGLLNGFFAHILYPLVAFHAKIITMTTPMPNLNSFPRSFQRHCLIKTCKEKLLLLLLCRYGAKDQT